MTIALAGSLRRPLDRLAEALIDPRRRERTAILVLAAYVAAWTLYGVLAKGSQDIHFDMGEAVAWSRELAAGNPKHPPASAWLVRAWFAIFPLAEWAYYLLAVMVAGVGLWIAWILSARWLTAEKRVAGLALMTLVPFFNFHALKFNVNTVLIPLWAAATLFFVRSFETRRIRPAALAGLAAAGAMLGKYWSVTLIAGLGIAALLDPRRGRYFASAAPWVTIAVGTLALAPHLVWLWNHDFAGIRYAMAVHPAAGLSQTLAADLHYLLGIAAYLAAPVALAVLATRPSGAAAADTLRPANPDRRFAAAVFWAPLLLPLVLALVVRGQIVSLWEMPALSLLPVVLLSSPLIDMPREQVVRLLGVAVAFPLLMLVAAPAIALMIHRQGPPHHAAHYRLLAREIERVWRDTSERQLRLLGSDTNLVNGVVFYLSDRPSTYDVMDPRQTPWAGPDRIAREGLAMVCPAGDRACVAKADALVPQGSPAARRIEVEISRRYLGIAGEPQRYLIETIPPRPDEPAAVRDCSVSSDSGPACTVRPPAR